jgi:glycosyltransferase involved in cell wall biosynthesis
MYIKKACAVVRHPSAVEGQTAFTRGFLRVLETIYGGNMYVIDTTANNRISYRYAFYIQELIRVFSHSSCRVLHSLNVNKPLISIIGLMKASDLVTYQFSYLPEVHDLWRIKRTLIEYGSTLIIGTSKRITKLFSRGFFTYPPVDTELFKPRDKALARRILGLPLNKIIVGYVGDIDDDRGFDKVVRLAATLGNDNVKFFISYLRVDTIKRETISYLKEALRRNTLIIRRLTPVWYVYNAVNVLLLPIDRTYFTEPPATLIEALASGTPIIGGSSPSMQDYEGLYIKVKSNDDYADAVDGVISDKDLLNELSVRCRRFAVRNLSYRSIARRLEGIFKRLGLTGQSI